MITSYPIKDQITVAICCYNAAHYLPNLIEKLSIQECSIPFEVLIINNNSNDNTQELIARLAEVHNVTLRLVNEFEQGIAFARNRAIQKACRVDIWRLLMPMNYLENSGYRPLLMYCAMMKSTAWVEKYPCL